MKRAILLVTCLLPLGLGLAQRLPETRPPVGGDGVPPERALLVTAQEAIDSGKPRKALPHLFKAMGLAFDQGPVLRALLAAAVADDDARALWAHELIALESDAKGKARVDRAAKQLLPPDDPWPAKLARARAAAAKELAKTGQTLRRQGRDAGGSPLGARWAADLAWELMRASPALVRAHAPDLNAALSGFVPEHAPVIVALQRVVDRSLAAGDHASALRAARCMQGLAAQARFKDLQGPPPPDLGGVAAAARQAISRARALQADALGEPLTLDQLRALTPPEREQFTRDHSSFDSPGRSISPTGLYRIETSCGFETLLGVTETVEDHHRRLLDFYGRDPFGGQQGIVRVVPRHSGLEAEGAPFWWAGGFQGGNVTTVQFSVGNIEGLGRTLTHELTHRFDGAIFPGMPAWIVEGRAVWTGAAYGHSSDDSFVDGHAIIGTVENAFIKGYAGKDKLEKLVTGTLDDYRDNYVAGYALWLYLSSWQEGGKAIFAAPLDRWMSEAVRGIQKPLKWFEANFADGKGGRPKGMDAFREGWAAFLKGFHWKSRADWLSRYVRRVPGRRGSPWVYDTPTWHRQRSRAEPYFGQDQARIAGDLFMVQGMREPAALAYAWSLEVDEWDPDVATTLAELFDERRLEDLAWILRAEVARKRSAAGREREGWTPTPAPFLGSVSKVRGFIETLDEAVVAYDEAGLQLAAGVLAADRDRLAAHLGLPTLGKVIAEEAAGPSLHAVDQPAVPLGLWGWIEDGLTGHEERRVEGLWYVGEDGDVIVGRKQPREGTGSVDRALWRRHAYTRSREWQAPGRYQLKTRVFFTTSFVSGTVVLGYGRRDRNLRFHFSAGDYMYSLGEKERAASLKSVRWSLGDLRGRDGALPGSAPGGTYEFEGEQASFRLELLVDGPEVHVFIEEDWVGSYHTIDGHPVEGHIGFAVDWGAVRMQHPTIRRLDRTALSGLERRWPGGFDAERPTTLRGSQLLNRRCHGLPIGTKGTLALWFPKLEDAIDGEEVGDAEFIEEAIAAAATAAGVLADEGYPMQLVLAVPVSYGAETLAELAAQLQGLELESGAPAPHVELATHAYDDSLTSSALELDPFGRERVQMLLIDEHGVLRARSHWFGGWKRLPGPLDHWAKVLRGRR